MGRVALESSDFVSSEVEAVAELNSSSLVSFEKFDSARLRVQSKLHLI